MEIEKGCLDEEEEKNKQVRIKCNERKTWKEIVNVDDDDDRLREYIYESRNVYLSLTPREKDCFFVRFFLASSANDAL